MQVSGPLIILPVHPWKELPYTLPQDFLLSILFQKRIIDIGKTNRTGSSMRGPDLV
jgi:siderophore synthetase component